MSEPLPELQRIIPVPDEISEPFWSSGADGRLRIQRCQGCGYFLHPPGQRCPECGEREFMFHAVSGAGEVYSFVVNHQQWHPSYPTPYVIASVELPEQPGLRIVSNLVECEPSELRIGLAVRVAFEPLGGWYIPLFVPEAAA